jgi:hypothetical protein
VARKKTMNSKQRFQTTLNHQQPDRVCVDFGATSVTGMHVSVVHGLRQRLLGEPEYRVKVIEPYQMLGELDERLQEALGIDIMGLLPRKSMFATEARDWKPFTLFDGTPCLVPGDFNLTRAPGGGWYMHPEGDLNAPPSGHMPEGGYFFDAVIRQEPLDDAKLNPADNLEEFGLFKTEDVGYYRKLAAQAEERSMMGTMLIVPGTAFGDIALVPAPFLKHPKGIRDVQEWYISTKTRRDYVYQIFETQCAIALQNIATLMEIFGDRVQAAMITGTDFGTQRGPFISVASYRDLFMPFHKRVNDLIHSKSGWKTFIHSCGSIYKLIPDFIGAGFDILNPVQCSATDMDAGRLKKEFGKDIVFWGGGVDTQKTMAFGTPDEVYREVRERIEIFNDGGGFVFNSIHNVQGNTSIDNVLAMFKAIKDSGK